MFDARNEHEASLASQSEINRERFAGEEIFDFDDEFVMTTKPCSRKGCNEPRHITRSGNVRGYCAVHEVEVSLKSKARAKAGNPNHECNDACMYAQPTSPCVCGCGGVNHAIKTMEIQIG